MKNNLICIKCNSKEIKKVKSFPIKVKLSIIPKYLSPNYYVCCNCGYIEIWAESKEELNFIKNNKLK